MTDTSVPAAALDPVGLPAGASMLFAIGAPRTGHLWLYHLLAGSGHVHVPAVREVGYFDAIYGAPTEKVFRQRVTHMRTALDALGDTPSPDLGPALQRFARLAELMPMYGAARDDHDLYVDYVTRGHGGQRLIADFSRGYARLDREGFAQMGRIGSARFIYILRDPLSRVWSQFRATASKTAPDPAALAEDCNQRALKLLMTGEIPVESDYAGTLHELLSVVPDGRVHIGFQETLDTPASLHQIAAFLDIPHPEVPRLRRPNASPPAQPDPEIAQRMVDLLLPQYRFALEAFGDELPRAWLDTIDRYT